MAKSKALKWWLVGGGTVLVVLAAYAALVAPKMMRSNIAHNESSAIVALRAYLMAQLNHRRATGRSARDLKALVGHGLDPEIAAAQFGEPGAAPSHGYYLSGPMPKLLLFAFPARYGRAGRHTFMIDQSGTIYQRGRLEVDPDRVPGGQARCRRRCLKRPAREDRGEEQDQRTHGFGLLIRHSQTGSGLDPILGQNGIARLCSPQLRAR